MKMIIVSAAKKFLVKTYFFQFRIPGLKYFDLNRKVFPDGLVRFKLHLVDL
jgi:hypothetical protein